MPSFLERAMARAAFWHADRVYRRFTTALQALQASQQAVLSDVLGEMKGSAFCRDHGLRRVRTIEDFRRAVPIRTYDELRPYLDRVRDGDCAALLARGRQVLMFATSSGTTAARKYIPITRRFVREYRRGWNTFGLKLLSDHRDAVLRSILQVTGRMDESHSPRGVPCGAITGLLAREQKGIVRRFYVGVPQLANIADAAGRYYALARLGIVRDVAFAITANPATLIRIAQTADEMSESLIRDVRDGTLSETAVPEADVRRAVLPLLRPDPQRAAELEALRCRGGRLAPRDYWRLSFVACWTGGSMSGYRERLASWYGDIPVRDIGLLASEGRVTIPLTDGTAGGVLDPLGQFFEFIPLAEADRPNASACAAHELQAGGRYVVVLTNFAGLARYRLDDVIHVTGFHLGTPVMEFLHRFGRVSSVAGEKLTENQVVAAMRVACQQLGIPEPDYVISPCWGDPPHYRCTCSVTDDRLARALDEALCGQNDEYESRRKSNRLSMLQQRFAAPAAFAAMDRQQVIARGGAAEQYKRQLLFTQPGDDDRLGH
jgi:GH3 auxin-responsive promoter